MCLPVPCNLSPIPCEARDTTLPSRKPCGHPPCRPQEREVEKTFSNGPVLITGTHHPGVGYWALVQNAVHRRGSEVISARVSCPALSIPGSLSQDRVSVLLLFVALYVDMVRAGR